MPGFKVVVERINWQQQEQERPDGGFENRRKERTKKDNGGRTIVWTIDLRIRGCGCVWVSVD